MIGTVTSVPVSYTHLDVYKRQVCVGLAKSVPMSENANPSGHRASPQPESRSGFKVFQTIGTRWMDNDAYGHVNNVVYYSWFDTAVNAYLIEQGVLDIHQGQTIGLVIETQCNYFSPLAFPQAVEAVSYTHLDVYKRQGLRLKPVRPGN